MRVGINARLALRCGIALSLVRPPDSNEIFRENPLVEDMHIKTVILVQFTGALFRVVLCRNIGSASRLLLASHFHSTPLLVLQFAVKLLAEFILTVKRL